MALILRDLHIPGDLATAWLLHSHAGIASAISGPVALRLQGWPIDGDDHLIVAPGPPRPIPQLTFRTLRRPSPSIADVRDAPPLVQRLDALADVLVARPERQAYDTLDHALQRRCITSEDVAQMAERRSGVGSRGQRRLRNLRARAASGSRSEAEQIMGALLRRSGGSWTANYAIRDRAGGVIAEIDFADVELRIAIEVDGRAFHSDRRSFERDRTRQNILALDGWLILRFTWERLSNEPQGVIKEVEVARRQATERRFRAEPA